MEKNSIYDKNMEFLKAYYINIYEAMSECTGENVYLDKSVNGEDIIAVGRNERLYYFNSRYNDDEFTDIWAEQFRDCNYKAVFILFGLSNFGYVRKLMKITQSSNDILLYEPDKEVFAKAISCVDISELLAKENITLCVKNLNEKDLKEFILKNVSYAKINLFNFCSMPNYSVLYDTEWNGLINEIKGRFELLIMNRNTEIAYSDEMVRNMLMNCRDLIEQHSMNQLREAFIKVGNIQDIPAIIVSAGPSLDKNIESLKKAVGKSVIISVDTAIKPLLEKGIVPDIVVTVDGHKPVTSFAHSRFNNIAVIASQYSNNKLWTIHNGRRFYFSEPDSYMSYLYTKIRNEVMLPTETGGSVANNAFSAAQLMGFRKIILIGQDLAYPGRKSHASGSYSAGVKNVENDKEFFEVEDIFGGTVLTEGNMNLYRRWFESQIIIYGELEVIDATEGGAKIAGTRIMTLDDAIDVYCKNEIDAKKLIEDIPELFTEQEKAELRKEIDGIVIQLEEIKKKINNGLRNYDKLQELFRKGKAGTKEFSRVVTEIGEFSQYIESKPILELAGKLNKEAEYEVLGTVYDTKENVSEEIKYIVNSGTKMLESYKKAIDKLRNIIEKADEVDSGKLIKGRDNIIKTLKEIILYSDEPDNIKINTALNRLYGRIVVLIRAFGVYKSDKCAGDNGREVLCDNNRNMLYEILRRVEIMGENKEYHNLAREIEEDILRSIEDMPMSNPAERRMV